MRFSSFSWLVVSAVGLLALSACTAAVPEDAAKAAEKAAEKDSPGTGPSLSPGPNASPSGPEVSSAPARPPFSTAGWKTDFSKYSISLKEITSGGPSKDGIPPVDDPTFQEVGADIDWLQDNEPVVALVLAGEAKAYPLQILIWHEIVNDTVGGVPVSVTFCPLCNTAIAFDGRLDGQVYDFGTTGNLRYSDLVMYDRQTESWWQQITGEAIIGELTGKQLTLLPAPIISWKDFKGGYPQGTVLSRDTGFSRSYGSNPYAGYDDVNSSPFLFRGPSDGRLAPMERVATVSLNGEDVAYPFTLLEEKKVIQHSVGGKELVVVWAKGTASALDDRSIADSRDIGATNVFEATLDGKPLTFEAAGDGAFVDKETGTTWNLLGQGQSGPLAGKALRPVVHANHFWFAWAVFKPETIIYQP